MRKLPALAIIFLVIASAPLAEQVKMTMKEYARRSEKAATQEAYERAHERLGKVKLGMKTRQFFSQMEMLFLRDKDGNGVDGFCEGHLRKESQKMTEGKRPDHYLIFGYYQNWKKSKNPVQKFYVVFRDRVLTKVVFFDPKDDIYGLGDGSRP